jgi:para-aminobenzoate synthetase/4-amino-4-deoxychorismate lyase
VPIRSLLIDAAGKARLDVGSGIVIDSRPAAEWAECHLKSRFLTALPKGLRLIETLRLEPGAGYPSSRAPGAPRRLGSGLRFSVRRSGLPRRLAQIHADAARRVRVTLGQAGDFSFEKPASRPARREIRRPSWCPPPRGQPRPAAAPQDHRPRALRFGARPGDGRRAFRRGVPERKGELTEGARTNVFVERAAC